MFKHFLKQHVVFAGCLTTIALCIGLFAWMIHQDNTHRHRERQELRNVVLVLMHQPGHFSVVTEDPQTKIQKIWSSPLVNAVGLYRDVPAGNYGWGEFRCTTVYGQYDGNEPDTLIVHYAALQSVQGGGWHYGKFGSGQTVVIP